MKDPEVRSHSPRSLVRSPSKRPSPSSVKTNSVLGNGHGAIDPLVGTTIDKRYRLLEKLGGGGMGNVYKAEHMMMDRLVAIKLLHRHLATGFENEEFIKRFQREARTACRIEHPNAVTIYDFGVWEGQPFIVMQYNPGRNLKKIIMEEGPLVPQRCFEILSQAGKAVSEAHKHNIVHRDLKPDNIMCFRDEDNSERVQVLDFGLAKVVDGSDGNMTTVTKTGIVMGTPQYMAPEQAIGRKLDARSDVYAMGIILFEMLTRQLPFKADTPMQLMLKHINEPPTPMRELKLAQTVPTEVEAVVLKALKKEPGNRYQSVVEFLADLKAAVTPKKLTSAPAASERVKVNGTSKTRRGVQTSVRKTKKRDRTKSPQKKRRWGIAAVASMIFFGATMGVVLNPLVVYFSPEEMAKRAAELELKKRVNTHIKRAQQNVAKDDLNTAVYELLLARRMDENNPEIYYELGNVYVRQYRSDQAIVVLEKAVELDPNYSQAYSSLGNVFYQQGNLRSAAKAYEKALALDPKDVLAKKNLRICKRRLRQYFTAAE